MIPVSEARERLLGLISALPAEEVPLARAAGRVLARDAVARRDQPPFAAASMDGYAIKSAEAETGAMFRVIGEAAAGHRFDGTAGPGEAVRIFTGAPIPDGTDFVVIQEDVSRSGDLMTIVRAPGSKSNIRPRGGDFCSGTALPAPRILSPSDIALLAAMNIAAVPVTRRPVVALIATGDELVMPGEAPGPDQIIASNGFGLKAMLEALGAKARMLPIARDSVQSLQTAFALTDGADLVVTIGGASAGDHDLVGRVAGDLGLKQAFYKVAMRPGKPLMAGRLGGDGDIDGVAMVGLPGNPVSAMVCGQVFLAPMVRAMLGLGGAPPPLRRAVLSGDLGANGAREHYMRAVIEAGQVRAFDNQDSALLTVLAQANALVVRAPHDPPRPAGDEIAYIPI